MNNTLKKRIETEVIKRHMGICWDKNSSDIAEVAYEIGLADGRKEE
jgi:hypothetical protein